MWKCIAFCILFIHSFIHSRNFRSQLLLSYFRLIWNILQIHTIHEFIDSISFIVSYIRILKIMNKISSICIYACHIFWIAFEFYYHYIVVIRFYMWMCYLCMDRTFSQFIIKFWFRYEHEWVRACIVHRRPTSKTIIENRHFVIIYTSIIEFNPILIMDLYAPQIQLISNKWSTTLFRISTK